jgi:hypothetical protein
MSLSQISIDELTVADVLGDYPAEGVQVSITFTREDMVNILSAYISNEVSIFEHIIEQVTRKRQQG